MKSVRFYLIVFMILPFFSVSAQRLRKADRLIVSNMQAHISYLNGKALQERKPGSNGEKLADDYIRKHFERWGLKPRGDGGTWYQRFELDEGKQVLPSSYLEINNKKLTLFEDYFPFPFSATKNAEGSVAIALAENGFPWFKDLKDITEDSNADSAAIVKAIRSKAVQAAEKGATALVIYNSTGEDIHFTGKDSSEAVSIPVVFITKEAFKKYCGDETATVDVKLNVALGDKRGIVNNVIGYADKGSDSTTVVWANLDNEANIAALLELARLSKNIKPKKNNYLFVASSGRDNESGETKYFMGRAPVDLQKVKYILDIDSVSKSEQYTNGLNLVKQSMQIMQDK